MLTDDVQELLLGQAACFPCAKLQVKMHFLTGNPRCLRVVIDGEEQ